MGFTSSYSLRAEAAREDENEKENTNELKRRKEDKMTLINRSVLKRGEELACTGEPEKLT